jgi:hypothetical protein
MFQFFLGIIIAFIGIFLYHRYFKSRFDINEISGECGKSINITFLYKHREYTTTLIRQKTRLIISADHLDHNNIPTKIAIFRQGNEIIFPSMKASDFDSKCIKIVVSSIDTGATKRWIFESNEEITLEKLEKKFSEESIESKTVELGDE